MSTANRQSDSRGNIREGQHRIFIRRDHGLRDWWVHIWGGLVRDVNGKHRKVMGQAIWLYLYLLLGANWQTGTLLRKIPTIASQMGMTERTVYRWLKVLRENRYIETRSNGRALKVSITKWRPVKYGKFTERR